MVSWPVAVKKAVTSLSWESDAASLDPSSLEQQYQAAMAPIPAPVPPVAGPSADDPGGAAWRALDEQTSAWKPVTDDYQPPQTAAPAASAFPSLDQQTAHWGGPEPQPAATSAPAGMAPSAASARGVPSAMPTGAAQDDGSLEGWARSEARRLGIDPETAVRVAKTEGGFDDPVRQNMQGAPAYGPYQMYIGGPSNPGLGDELLARGIDPRKPEHARASVTAALEHAAKNGWGAFQGAAANGIGNWEGIGQASPSTPVQAEQTPAAQAQAPSQLTPDQAALDDPDKWSLCGPVAAVAMARSRGGNWTVAQAKAYAQQHGLWNADQGMGGLETEAQLLRGMGYAAQAGPLDWQKAAQDAATGNPVTLSTTFIPGGHYVVLEKFDAKTGKFYVGGLGNTLKKTTGMSSWMSPAELEALGGIQGALHFDNPATPTPSVASASLNAAPATGAAAPFPSSGTSAGGQSQPPADASLDAYKAPAGPEDMPLSDGSVPSAGAQKRAKMGLLPDELNPNLGVHEGTGPRDLIRDGSLGFPVDTRYPGDQPYDAEGADRSMDPLTGGGRRRGPWQDDTMPQAPGPAQRMTGLDVPPDAMYRQPLSQQPELPADQSYDPRQYDAGPRELAPSPQYGPEAPMGPNVDEAAPSQSSALERLYDTAGNAIGWVQNTAAPGISRAAQGVFDAAKDPSNAVNTIGEAATAAGQAAYDATTEPETLATGLPALRGIKIVQDAVAAFGDVVGRRVADSMGWTDDEWFSVFGHSVSGKDVAGMIGQTVLDPTNYIGAGEARTAGRSVAGMVEPVVEASRGALQSGARAASEAASGAGRRISEGLAANAERVAELDARAARQGSTVAPGTFGFSPDEQAMRGLTRPEAVPNYDPVHGQLSTEIADLERKAAAARSRSGHPDAWGTDYAARDAAMYEQQIARRREVRAGIGSRRNPDFPNTEPRVIVPEEAGQGIREGSDWNSGDKRWSQPNGATVRGVPITPDDPRIPDRLYHATTNLPSVQADGMLRAGGVGGLGGDSADNMVSLTTSRQIADQIADDIKLSVGVARIREPIHETTWTASDGRVFPTTEWTSPEAGQAYQQQVIRMLKERARADGWEWEPYLSDSSRGKDILRSYFSDRLRAIRVNDPIIVSDMEVLAGVDPSKVGVVEVPRDSLRTGALLTDFDLGRGHLEEARLYGDVPLVPAPPSQPPGIIGRVREGLAANAERTAAADARMAREGSTATAGTFGQSWDDISRNLDSDAQRAAREEAMRRGTPKVQPDEEAMIRSEYGRRYEDPRVRLGGPSNEMLADAGRPPREAVRPNELLDMSGPVQIEPQGMSMNAGFGTVPEAPRRPRSAPVTGPPQRVPPPEGYAAPGELSRGTADSLPNRQVYERAGWQTLDGGFIPPASGSTAAERATARAERMRVWDEITPNQRIPPGLKNPDMEAFLDDLARMRDGILTGDTKPETSVLGSLIALASVKRSGRAYPQMLDTLTRTTGRPAEELAARTRPDIYFQGPPAPQEKGILMRPEILWAMVAGDTTDPVMMKMLAGIARPESFANPRARQAAIEQGVQELYRRIGGGSPPSSAAPTIYGAMENVESILGRPRTREGVLQGGGTPWSETEPNRWQEIVGAVKAMAGQASEGSPLAGKTGEALRLATIDRLLENSPSGIGPVKTRFTASMTALPDYATLDTRMLRDVYGLSPKTVLATDEYEKLAHKLWDLGSDSKYLYGQQWLPWEFLTGEKTTYNALTGVYDRINGFFARAEKMAEETGRPLGGVIDMLARQEKRVDIQLANPAHVQARVGLAFRELAGGASTSAGHEALIEGLQPGEATKGALQKAFPHLFKLADDAGIAIEGKPGVGIGGWKSDDTGKYYLDRTFDFSVAGPKPAVRWFAGAMMMGLPKEEAVLLTYRGAGAKLDDHVGSLSVKGMTRPQMEEWSTALSDAFPGWSISAKPRTVQGQRLYDIDIMSGAKTEFGGSGHDLEAQMTALAEKIQSRGHVVKFNGIEPAEMEFLERADVEEVVRGGPRGATVVPARGVAADSAAQGGSGAGFGLRGEDGRQAGGGGQAAAVGVDPLRNQASQAGISDTAASASAGALPATQSTDRLGAVNRVLAQGVASTFSGGTAAAAADQLGDPNDPNRQAKAFVAGALAPTLIARGAGRLARSVGREAEGAGGALASLGNVPGRPDPANPRVLRGQKPINLTQAEEVARLRLDKFPPQLRGAIQEAAQSTGFAHGARRGVIPDAVAEQMADGVNRTVDDWITKSKAGKSLNTEETRALRNLVTGQAQKVDGLAQEIADAEKGGVVTDLLIARAHQEGEKLAGLVSVMEGARAEAGRTLRAWAADARPTDPTEAAQRIFRKFGGGPEGRQRALDALKEFNEIPVDDPIARAGFWARVERGGKITGTDVLTAIRYNSMLSSPRTWEIGWIGSVLQAPVKIASDAIAATSRPLSGELGEAAKGAALGIKAGLRPLWETAYHGITSEDALAGQLPRGLAARATSTPGKIAGTLIDLPGRMVAAPDAFFTQMFKGAETGRQAAIAAYKAGLKGAERDKFIQEFATNTPKPAEAEINRVVDGLMLRGDMGRIGRWASGVATKDPLIGSFVAPFMKVSYHIWTQGMDLTPVGALGTGIDVLRGAYRGGRPTGVRPLGERARANAIGVGITGAATWQALHGNVSGVGPDDPEKRDELRATGWQPYSVKLGDNWVSYANWGPVAVPLAMAAAYAENQQYKKSNAKPEDQMFDMAKRVSQLVTEQTFLQGIGTIMNAFEDPQRYLPQFLAGQATSLIPYGSALNTVGQAQDDYQRRPDKVADVGVAENLRQAVESRIPMNPLTPDRSDVPIAQGPLGEPVRNQQSGPMAFQPFRISPQRDDQSAAVGRAYLDIGVDLAKPPSSFTSDGVKIDMTPDQQRAYQRYMGEYIQRGFARANNASDRRRAEQLKTLYEDAREAASTRVQSEIGRSEIRNRVRAGGQR